MKRKKKKIKIHFGPVNFLDVSLNLALLYTHRFAYKAAEIDGIRPPKLLQKGTAWFLVDPPPLIKDLEALPSVFVGMVASMGDGK